MKFKYFNYSGSTRKNFDLFNSQIVKNTIYYLTISGKKYDFVSPKNTSEIFYKIVHG